MSKSSRLILVAALLVYGLFFAVKIDLARADLGRVLVNGRLFVEQGRMLDTNLYSYTHPDHPILNQHWGADAVFYLIFKLSGFTGLSVANILFQMLALLFFLLAAYRRSGVYQALFAALLVLPLLTTRTYIRPEVFSFILLGAVYCLLDRFADSPQKAKALWWIPVLQVLWVNLHFFFWLGPLTVAAFLWQAKLSKQPAATVRSLAMILGATVLACLVNPFFIRGALFPLAVFQPYGYLPPECLSIVALWKLMPSSTIVLFFLSFGILVTFSTAVANAEHFRWHAASLALSFFFGLLTILVWRVYPLFGFIFIPTVCGIVGDRGAREFKIACVLAIAFRLFMPLSGLASWPVQPGLGLKPGMNASAEFFRSEGLKGPIFNNFGIGGYLSYHLYPQERVFVDNRPEAYPASFFKEAYLPMLADPQVWKKMEERYGFNAIYFHLRMHDQLPSAKLFLIKRLFDRDWAVVYIDAHAVILLKRNAGNQALIGRFEIPPDRIHVG